MQALGDEGSKVMWQYTYERKKRPETAALGPGSHARGNVAGGNDLAAHRIGGGCGGKGLCPAA